MQFERQHRDSGGINITPIIDMVFLLLIFFLLTSSFIQDKGIKVSLPSSSSSFSQKQKRITVTIDAHSEIFLEGRKVDGETLVDQLKGSYLSKGTKNVLIKTDQGNTVDRLVQVMDLIKQSGADRLTLATRVNVPQDRKE